MRKMYLAIFNIYIKETLHNKKLDYQAQNIQARYLFSVLFYCLENFVTNTEELSFFQFYFLLWNWKCTRFDLVFNLFNRKPSIKCKVCLFGVIIKIVCYTTLRFSASALTRRRWYLIAVNRVNFWFWRITLAVKNRGIS